MSLWQTALAVTQDAWPPQRKLTSALLYLAAVAAEGGLHPRSLPRSPLFFPGKWVCGDLPVPISWGSLAVRLGN